MHRLEPGFQVPVRTGAPDRSTWIHMASEYYYGSILLYGHSLGGNKHTSYRRPDMNRCPLTPADTHGPRCRVSTHPSLQGPTSVLEHEILHSRGPGSIFGIPSIKTDNNVAGSIYDPSGVQFHRYTLIGHN